MGMFKVTDSHKLTCSAVWFDQLICSPSPRVRFTLRATRAPGPSPRRSCGWTHVPADFEFPVGNRPEFPAGRADLRRADADALDGAGVTIERDSVADVAQAFAD